MANIEKSASTNTNANHKKAGEEGAVNHNKSTTEQARETVQQAGQTIGEKTKNATEQLKEQTAEIGAAMSDYVRKRPCTALGLAALVGMTVGFLLRK